MLKIRGVELRLHFSLVFLIFYVMFVSAVEFPSVVNQAGLDIAHLNLSPVFAGAVFALGLLLSIILHEFGHVLVAQGQGISVRGVTLMMLGGVSEMAKTPDRPYSELKLAIAGPMVSFGIWGILSLLRGASILPEFDLFAYWLGSANLVLALFNLLPAFPLDGGRVLRSILAAKQGNLRGTQNAVRVSHVFAWAFGILGLIHLNIFVVLIALFIYSAAQSEWTVLMTQDLFRNVRVRDAMRRIDPLYETTLLNEALSRMIGGRAQILPIELDAGRAGLIELTSLKSLDHQILDNTRVREKMQIATRILNSNDSIDEILPDILTSPLLALPVQEDGHIRGVLRQQDLTELIPFRNISRSLQDSSKDEKTAA